MQCWIFNLFCSRIDGYNHEADINEADIESVKPRFRINTKYIVPYDESKYGVKYVLLNSTSVQLLGDPGPI